MASRAAFLAVVALAGCTPTTNVAGLQRTLAANGSATVALEQWCGARGFAPAPQVTARLVQGAKPAEPTALRERLGVGSGAPLGYRHVELTCGGRVLSVAQNWFVRERLTAQMNAVLDRSDVPFGKVVAPLHFTRETVEERRGAAPGCPRGTALSHLAMLRLPGGAPLASLTECYTRAAVR